ncbi:MAG: hypothetical protein VB111_12945 [Clostridiaceae bacterium]|nr:hypothetical protein [Clostridiaceae bacterium]
MLEIEPFEEGWYCNETTFVDGKMYITQIDASAPDGGMYKRLYSCNLDGTDMRLFYEDYGNAASDGQRLYWVKFIFPQLTYDTSPGASELIILNPDGTVSDRLALDVLPDLPDAAVGLIEMFPTAGDKVILAALISGSASEYLYYFPKSEIGTGNITPVQFMSYLRD